MKKLKTLLIFVFTVLVLMIFASCKTALSAPTGITIDLNNTLSWRAVAGARRYVVEITDLDEENSKDYSTPKVNYSLNFLDEGDYEIRIKAVAASESVKDSEWTEAVVFKKTRETGCIYKLVNNIEYHIVKFGSASGRVEIEDIYRGKPVTAIEAGAFKGCRDIEEVIVGNNVVTIGDNAFYNCPALRSIALPEGLETIGAAAFHSCPSLTSIAIPNSIKEISTDTFAYCRALKEVKWGGVVSIGESAFSNCSGLTSVVIPDTVQTLSAKAFFEAKNLQSVTIGKNVQSIGARAFLSCESLTEILFAEGAALTSIEEYAFNSCTALTIVNLPEGLTEIGEGAFYLCDALQNVTIPDSVQYVRRYAFSGAGFYAEAALRGDMFIYADNWVVHYTKKQEKDENGAFTILAIEKKDFKSTTVGIADYAFIDSEGLEAVEIPKSVKHLGEHAFYSCGKLYRVDLSASSIQEISERAFASCPLLSQVYLQNNRGESSILRIGPYAFYNCASLNLITIPSSVVSIGTYAFRATKIWDTPDESGVIYAGKWVVGYADDANLVDVALKEGTVGISDYAFYNCSTLKSVTGLAQVKNLGYAAFYKCSALERVALNSNITVIQPYTFYKCTALFDVAFPDSLVVIGRSAFYKCETLNELNLSEVWTYVDDEGNEIGLMIDDYAFYGCTNIESILFSEKTQSIGDYAFYKCSNLRALDIQDTITHIGERAFANCSALETLSIGEGVDYIGERAFQNCAALKEVTIPANIQEIGNYAFYKCTSLAVVNIEDGEGELCIGNYAFYGAENLQRVYLPERLTSIGKYAFKGSTLLQSVVLGKNVTEVGMHAFYGCKSLTIYVEAEAAPTTWHQRWNSSYRPVVFGCTLSEDGTYVVSVTVTENTFANVKEANIFMSPKCSGHAFAGWSATVSGEEKIYQANEIATAPVGTTLTAIWDKGDEPLVELPKEEPEEEGADSSSAAQ